MKVFVYLFFLLTILACAASIPQQEKYTSHKVQEGETVYSIAKKYGISETDIYRLNPDARAGIGLNSVLIIPASSSIIIPEQQLEFKRHKVKRKETLFSIAQLYNIKVDDIKKYNKHLYSKGLKKGEKLQIPVFSSGSNTTVVTNTTETATVNTSTNDYGKHVIQPKETKYGIARMYNISIAELESINPLVPENFPIGTELNVPRSAVTSTATIEDERFAFYEVLPKEGFFRLKVKLGLTEEEIVAINPYAKDGLKEGMILKIPKEVSDISLEDVDKIKLENRITDKSKKRIAILLPFSLKNATDSISANEDLLKSNRTLRIALDFYSGVKLASEFIKDKGISVELNVFDTEGSGTKLASILSRNDLNDMNAVIGPLLSKNVERTAAELKSKDVPVFSPLSNRNIKLTSNLFQTLPSNELLEEQLIEYLKEHSEGKNMIIICDKNKSQQKAALQAALPNAIALAPREKGFLYVADIESKIDKTRENWFVLESSDPVIISNVVGLLNGLPDNYNIRLFTTDRNENYEYHDISNLHLANLDFTFPSVSKSYNFDEKNAFLVSYKNTYGVLPNRYAVRGFDVTYDVLLRLAVAGNVYDATSNDFETEYVENKFRYEKKMFSGYTNNAFYILKLNQDLNFEVVK